VDGNCERIDDVVKRKINRDNALKLYNMSL